MSNNISISAIERIFNRVGAKRVAEDTKVMFRDYIERYAEKLAEKIVRITRHGKRKTVKIKDMLIIIKD